MVSNLTQRGKRVADTRISSTGPVVAGVAGRYATALFDLARDAKALDAVAASLDKVAAALDQSPDFAALIRNPLISRDQAAQALARVSESLGLDALAGRFLGVLANNRRLGALADTIAAFRALLAHYKGETTAQVASAHPLKPEQVEALKGRLAASLGKAVQVETRVDPSLLGGLVVKIGSRMIDASLKTKLDTLSLAMKG